jgi:beta-galactosidase
MLEEEFFPIAVWYGGTFMRPPMMSREVLDKNKVENDLRKIRKTGFNAIKYWVDWATCNPSENTFDFNQVRKFMDIIGKTDLKVIVQIYIDSAPNWVAKKFPDSFFVSQSDHKVESQSSPGYSLDHPEVRKLASTFMNKLAELILAYPNFYAWDVWSEPHVVNWSWFDYMGNEPWFDYSIYSRNRFVKWLKKKYRRVNNLNKAWYRTYSSWDEVQIPKYVTLSTFQDIIDWQMFTVQKLKEDLKFRVDSIRKIDRNHIISSHSAITSVMTSILDWGANGNDWEMSKVVDVWGTSYYPAHIGSLNPYDPSVGGLFLDASRSSCESTGKPFWIGELQSGQAIEGLKFGIPVGREEISRWAWSCISHGAKGLFFYAYYPMSCGVEISGFGMIPFSGKGNERSEEVGKISKIISDNMKTFLALKPIKAKVAILINIRVTAFLTALRENENIFSMSLRGTYRILFEEKIYPDFIDADNLSLQILRRYKVIFAPLLLVVDKYTTNILREFVEGGGTLIAEFRPGWSDYYGRNTSMIPGSGMDEVFGCVEDCVIDKKNTIFYFETAKERTEIAYNSKFEVLKLMGAYSVLKNECDQVIATTNNLGKGKATLIGAMLSSFYEVKRDISIKKAILSLLGDLDNLTIPVNANHNEIEIRLMKSGTKSLIFAFNHNNKDFKDMKILIKETLVKAKNLMSGENLQIREEDGRSEINIQLMHGEVAVIELSGQ